MEQENDAQRTAAQADLDRAANEKAQAEAEKTQLRAQLLLQFNTILETRDTARGLIVNMSDVLFERPNSLRPLAREKLAKVAESYRPPGLKLTWKAIRIASAATITIKISPSSAARRCATIWPAGSVESASVTTRGLGKISP